MSTALEISVRAPALEGLEARIRRLAAGLGDTRPLLEALGAEVESQTRRRIASEKSAPDGAPWPEWSEAYASTRHGGQSLLQADGGLLDSIQSLVSGDLAEVGSNLVYAAIQQFGGLPSMSPGPAAVQAREWLGISADNESDLHAVLGRWVEGELRGALA